MNIQDIQDRYFAKDGESVKEIWLMPGDYARVWPHTYIHGRGLFGGGRFVGSIRIREFTDQRVA